MKTRELFRSWRRTTWVDGLAGAFIFLLAVLLTIQVVAAGDGQEILVTSPEEGFFYVGENPGDAPLVQVGDAVEADTVVGYVQSTEKLPIFAGAAGTIVTIEVEDLAPVSAGQVVMRLATN